MTTEPEKEPEQKPEEQQPGALPPKLDLRKRGILRETPKDGGVGRKTTRIILTPDGGVAGSIEIPAANAPAAAAKPPEAAAKPPEAAPKEKQVLPAAQPVSDKEEAAPGKREPALGPPEAAEAAKPKTIRIKPAPLPSPAAAAVRPAVSGETQPLPGAAPKPGEKRQTSRIPLDSALEAPERPAAGPVPKTIRLKRPSEAPTVKATPQPPPAKAESPKQALGKTARLDEAKVGEAAETPTQRKTIRVKRPAGAPAAAPVPMAVLSQAAAPAEEETGFFFPVLAVVAILVICVTIYLFAAQAFGPDVSLTKLSYGGYGVDLPWPGKISSM